MLRKVRRHGLDHGNFVNHFFFGQMREKIGYPSPALSPLLEFPRTLEDFPDRVELSRGKLPNDLPRILPVVLLKSRLVIEGVHMRRTTVHVEENAFLARGENGTVWEQADQRNRSSPLRPWPAWQRLQIPWRMPEAWIVC